MDWTKLKYEDHLYSRTSSKIIILFLSKHICHIFEAKVHIEKNRFHIYLHLQKPIEKLIQICKIWKLMHISEKNSKNI